MVAIAVMNMNNLIEITKCTMLCRNDQAVGPLPIGAPQTFPANHDILRSTPSAQPILSPSLTTPTAIFGYKRSTPKACDIAGVCRPNMAATTKARLLGAYIAVHDTIIWRNGLRVNGPVWQGWPPEEPGQRNKP